MTLLQQNVLKVVVFLFKNYLNRDRVVGKIYISELEHFEHEELMCKLVPLLGQQ